VYLSSTFLNPDSTLGTVDSRGPFYPSLAEQLSLVVPSSEAAKCCSDAQTVLLKQTKYEVFFNPSLAVHAMLSLDIVGAYNTKHFFGNQLVSYTRQMDLVRIRDQAKFENASLRTKHFTI